MESRRAAGSTISMEGLAAQLRMLELPEQQEAGGLREELVQRASVLAYFNENQLQVHPANEPEQAERRAFLAECDRLERGAERHVYQLPLALRRAALRKLATRERMLAVRARLRWPAEDCTERMFDQVLRGVPVDLAHLSGDELASLAVVREWVSGILPDLPDSTRLRARLSIEKTLSPLRHLVGTHFVGRKTELARLSDHVGVLPVDSIARKGQRLLRQVWLTLTSRPPLVVYGPGGVGKSSLIAQFILMHLAHEDEATLPFVHLDLDRTLIDPRDSLTLLAEAASQLSAQFPSHHMELTRLSRQLVALRKGNDPLETSKSTYTGDEPTRLFGNAVTRLLGENRPLLWVMDTFEEAQKLGDSVVRTLWQFFEELQSALPGLRLVVSGRVLPTGFSCETMKLTEFDPESARSFLRHRFRKAGTDPMPTDEQLDAMLDAVGRSPLALRMAVRVALIEGTGVFRSREFHGSVLWKMHSDQIQAQLFHRILEHIDGSDNLKRIASPGLAVRRITPEVILHVLAEPCGLSITTLAQAQDLFAKLERQVDIVERDFSDGSLRHRTDVRRLMLRDLKRVAAGQMTEIDRRAVDYYMSRVADVDRAEEIYHRLRLGQGAGEVAPRWRHGVERYLQNALDELGGRQQIFLANQLGISLPAKQLTEASLDEWEIQTQRRVEDYLAAGDAHSALEVLAERRKPRRGSPLWRLQAEALRLARQPEEAAFAARRGLNYFSKEGNLPEVAEMYLLLALLKEERKDFGGALDDVGNAIHISRRLDNLLGELRGLTAQARLARKMDTRLLSEDEQSSAIRRLLTPPVLKALETRKAAYREVIAEFGHLDQEVLRRGVSYLGIDIATEHHLLMLNLAIAAMLDENPAASAILNQTGLQGYNEQAGLPGDVRRWIRTRSSTEIGKAIATALGAHRYAPPVLQQLASVFREGVDRTIARAQRSVL